MMPARPARPCTYAGCRALSRDGSGRCPAHPKESWAKPEATKRITGRKLQQLRAELFAEEPLCRHCLLEGRAVPATQRDHIIPLAEGGQDVRENTQALCDECHEAKSKAERMRGRWGRGG